MSRRGGRGALYDEDDLYDDGHDDAYDEEPEDYPDRPQLDAAWDAVYDVVGDAFSEAEIVAALRAEGYASEAATSRLLDAKVKESQRQEAARLKLATAAAGGKKTGAAAAGSAPAGRGGAKTGAAGGGKGGKAAAQAQQLAALEAALSGGGGHATVPAPAAPASSAGGKVTKQSESASLPSPAAPAPASAPSTPAPRPATDTPPPSHGGSGLLRMSSTGSMPSAAASAVAAAADVPLPPVPAAVLAAAAEGKPRLSLVCCGHVDAGKSTMLGHLLYDLGCVPSRTLQKYARESRAMGKASFAYAWVLDEEEGERARGITMDVGMNHFETQKGVYTLLDAPGHRDFVQSTVSGIAQADAAVLVVDASPGEAEMGLSGGGQTAEHATLVRAFGITQLIVAVNKLDAPAVQWGEARFAEVCGLLAPFLASVGFRRENVQYVPVSGLSGLNLVHGPRARLRALGVDAPPLPPPPSPSTPAHRVTSGGGGGGAASARSGLFLDASVGRPTPRSAARGGVGGIDDDDEEERERAARAERVAAAAHAEMLADMGLEPTDAAAAAAPPSPASPAGRRGGGAAASRGGGGGGEGFGPGGAAGGDVASAAVAPPPSSDDAMRLAAWYGGPTLVEAIDALRPPPRGALERPLRLCVSDVYRSPLHGLMVAGRLEGGYLLPHTRLTVVPSLEGFAVKGLSINGVAVPLALAGDNVDVAVGGIEEASLARGQVLCWPSHPVPVAVKFKAHVTTLARLDMPIVPGQQFTLHSHLLEEPCNVSRLLRTLDKDGHTLQVKPRSLAAGMTAVVRIRLLRRVPMERFVDHRRMGRFVLRYGDRTVAAGIVVKI